MIWFLLPIGLTCSIFLTLIGFLHGVDNFRAQEHQAEVIALSAIVQNGAISERACEIAIQLGAVDCYIDSQSIWVTGQTGGRARAGWPDS
jgi:hypothetical protein